MAEIVGLSFRPLSDWYGGERYAEHVWMAVANPGEYIIAQRIGKLDLGTGGFRPGADNVLHFFDVHTRGGEFWVVEDGGRIVATVGVLPHESEADELKALYVHPSIRR